MRYLLLILAVPFLTANAAAPDCESLKSWTKDLEVQMQSSRIKPCDEVTTAGLGLPADAPDFEKYRCLDFNAMELQLKSVESEIAILRGISTLKLEIANAQMNVKTSGSRNQVEINTKSFFRNLRFAADLELFLGANNSKNENILMALAKAKPSELESTSSFKTLIEQKCSEFNLSQASVCNQTFPLTEDFRADFLDLVRLGKKSGPKFDKAHVKRLKEALAIKVGNVDYSYTQFLKEMKNPDASVISSEDLSKLKSLPEISNSKKFDFITRLKNARTNLGKSQTLIEAQDAPAKFAGFLETLKTREQWELKSKLFVVLKTYEGRDMPYSAKDACNNSRELGPDVEACFNELEKLPGLKSFEVSGLKGLHDEFTNGQAQITKLDELLKECVPDQNLSYPAKCDGVVTDRLIELEQKSQMLNALKAKVFEPNPEILIFRNYALEKLMANECLKPEETNISNCYENIGNISREAVALTDSVNNIIYVYAKPVEATQIDQLCKQIKVDFPHKEEICKWKAGDVKKETSVNNDAYQAPVSPVKKSSTLSNIADLTGNLLKTFAPARPPGGFNPYPSPSPYNQGYPALLHPYQQMMAPAVGSGLGNYQNLTGSGYGFGAGPLFNAPFGR